MSQWSSLFSFMAQKKRKRKAAFGHRPADAPAESKCLSVFAFWGSPRLSLFFPFPPSLSCPLFLPRGPSAVVLLKIGLAGG